MRLDGSERNAQFGSGVRIGIIIQAYQLDHPAGLFRQALDRLEVDELGLDMVDRRMLEAMIRHYNGGPVGLDTLAAVIGEESVTIEDVYEPYLMQIGFLTRTPRGRVVLPAAYAHLGLPVPGQPSPEQPNLSFFDN